MSNTVKHFKYANEVSKKIGWLTEVIFTQWKVETAHFTSKNFKKNNNIAGQTWHPGLPLSSRGTARPKSEGGYYIKYDDPIKGYVDFVLSHSRYDKVKTYKTANEQFKEKRIKRRASKKSTRKISCQSGWDFRNPNRKSS